jgi:hypothetical protein
MKLIGQRKIDWVAPTGCPQGFVTVEVVQGNSDESAMYLEVAVAGWKGANNPTREQLTRLHSLRVNKTATPVVLVIELDSGGALVFGPNPEAAPIGPLPQEQAQRIIQAAIDEPSVLAARSRLTGLAQAVDSTNMPGVKNSGLFANHELRVGVPQRGDWSKACVKSTALLSERGPQLIAKLGYKTDRAGAHALVLTGKGPRPEAIAVLLDEREAFDADSPRFHVSPVAYGLKMANDNGVPWLIMLRGTQLRLYPARIEFGIGRKGLAETFFEVDLPHMTAENAGFLNLVFSADALVEGGTIYEILRSSSQYAVALGARLRDKVYEDIVPELSVAVAEALVEQGFEMDAEGLDLAYQLTLRVFFRMLFQVYAEDRKLLPYGENARYDRSAIKTHADDLVKNPDQEFDPNSTALWDGLAQVWKIIDSGDRAWGVPAYNGGLFTSDKEFNEHGAILKTIQITNDVMGPVLKALLLDVDDEGGIGSVDFRSLSVREFGTIYEGLLESSLGLAEVDLTLDKEGTWVPAKKKDEIYAYAGQVYFHNTSGQRKSTGSYFTPSFVVEHLLERALDPALDAHLAEVAKLLKTDQASAAEKFFDFRVADLAMGSGHFLTSAIDHIEQKMAAFLAEEGHFIPGVAAELQKLEQAAKDALGPDAPEPERSSLLRRQIARRCIYGLDINPIAVELARVSIWIHTFVRGLPMSSLDHNLVCANSLTGIGSVDEALDVLVPGRKGKMTLFDAPIQEALERARTVLVDAALLAEATKDEARAASKASKKAQKEAEQAQLLFDAAVLTRIGRGELVSAPGDVDGIARLAAQLHVQEVLQPLKPGHMPVLFPEVFLRDNGGFDVLIGNPPWEELMLDEVKYWLRVSPGLLGLPIVERRKEVEKLKRVRPDLIPDFEREVENTGNARKVLLTGPFPGLGTGDVDLYRVFAWRNWQLLRKDGSLGAVFPRTLLNAAGNALWREEVLTQGTVSVVNVVNSNGWVFPSVHGQYSIAFVNIAKTPSSGEEVTLSGPFFDLTSFKNGRDNVGRLSIELLKRASEGAAFPQLPDSLSAEIFGQIRKSPRLDAGIGGATFSPVREFDATLDKKVFDAGGPKDGRWPVYGGASFNIWNPSTGEIFAWADQKKVSKALQEKRQRQIRLKSSAFYGMDEKWASDESTLSCARPRIAYRQITNATNTRTVIAALVPGNCVITNAAPYFLMRDGSAAHEAFLLGVMCSIPFDWYVRRYVELNFNFHIVNGCPVPTWDESDVRQQKLIANSGRLAAVDKRFADWAKAAGVKVGSVKTEAEKELLITENDALVAHMYGLTREQIEHLFKTFHRGWDYMPRLTKVLAFYDALPKVKS